MSDIAGENLNKKSRLGRGLGSLLGGAGDALSDTKPTPMPAMNIQKHSHRRAFGVCHLLLSFWV